MKAIFLILVALLLSLQLLIAQNTYRTNSGYISFFSKAPISDVDAKNKKVKVEMDISTGELTVDIVMTDFVFENGKMGRDARKKYLEINKYPSAGFKGKIQGNIDYDKPGTYNATATGKLKIHGVENEVTQKGSVIVVDGKQIKLKGEFNVALKDYRIEVPEILGSKMTEDKVLVKMEATLSKGTKDGASKK